MKKISYRNKRIELKPKVKPCDLPTPPEAEEGFSGSANKGVGRGFASPGEPVMPAMYSEHEERPFFAGKAEKKPRKTMDYESLLELLVGIADEMDGQDDLVLAGFTDFLIKKVATQKSLDYSMLFRDLLIKVVESDVSNQSDILIGITKQFNRVLRLNMSLDSDISSAKRKAYQRSVARTKEYVR